MHVTVIGAGVVGITTAWYLRQDGHEVDVFDSRDEVARDTSFANGGQISVSHPEPWSNPRAPGIALRAIGRRDAPLRLHWRADPWQWIWCLRFLGECLPARSARNTRHIAALARLSLSELRRVRQSLGLDYPRGSQGILHLYFGPHGLVHARSHLRQLAENDIQGQLLSPAEVTDRIPALRQAQRQPSAGLLGCDDEWGDARRFTEALAEHCRRAGVRIHTERRIAAIRAGTTQRRPRIEVIDVSSGQRTQHEPHALVVSAGTGSRALLKPLGVSLPIFPMKGYSISAPWLDPEVQLAHSLTDEGARIVCSPLGDQLRVAGTAELNGDNRDIDPGRIEALKRWTRQQLPGLADIDAAVGWAGLRPATPSNRPCIGASGLPGIWLNTGHGSLGWTLSCGSAALISALISGRTTP